MSIKEHIDHNHHMYASYDNMRNLPHIADGLKTSQRKIIYTVLQTLGQKDEIKVANLGSRASDLTHYSHGEDSIIDAVTKMAADYAGSNNMPLLLKDGQFGTMKDNGASEPRYIYIRRHVNLNKLIDNEDLDIITTQTVDGDTIEPLFYLPKLPVLLINGARGVGNGYSSRILPRDPDSIKKVIKAIAAGKGYDPILLNPWFKGFSGRVEREGKQYQVTGTIVKVSRTKLRITSLPPDATYQYDNYKSRVLLKLLDAKTIRNFNDLSTETEWDIEIEAASDIVSKPIDELEKLFGLRWSVSETLNAWGWGGKIKMMETPDEVIRYWITGRLEWLEKRRLNMIQKYNLELDWLYLKMAFIKLWNRDNAVMVKLSKNELLAHMAEELVDGDPKSFDRLLSLRISSLTLDEVESLQAEITKLDAFIDTLKAATADKMLLKDIESV